MALAFVDSVTRSRVVLISEKGWEQALGNYVRRLDHFTGLIRHVQPTIVPANAVSNCTPGLCLFRAVRVLVLGPVT